MPKDFKLPIHEFFGNFQSTKISRASFNPKIDSMGGPEELKYITISARKKISY